MKKKFTALLLPLFLSLFPIHIYSQPFVTGHLMGQLGNQMFIIAAATNVALDNGAVPVFPGFHEPEQDPVFNLAYNYAHIFYHLNTSTPETKIEHIFRESPFNYNYEPIPYQPNMKIFGWFQSEKYFTNHKEEILTLFAPHQ